MRSKAAAEYVRAFRATLKFFQARDARPRVQRLDNKTSKELKHFFHHNAKVDVEYLPPKNHRSNKTERAIRDGKNHLIATLCTTESSFPIAAFDELIAQAELTPNNLRPCRHLAAVSAWEGLHGTKYDFFVHPIAPSAMRVLVFETSERGTFAPHGVDGFYLGPAADAYRCFQCFVTHTNSIRVSDTLAWFPQSYKMPGASVIEQLHQVIKDLATTFKVITTSNHIQAAYRQPFPEHAATATTALAKGAGSHVQPTGSGTDRRGRGTIFYTTRTFTLHNRATNRSTTPPNSEGGREWHTRIAAPCGTSEGGHRQRGTSPERHTAEGGQTTTADAAIRAAQR